MGFLLVSSRARGRSLRNAHGRAIAFTLIELLVVVAVLGLLVSLLVPSLQQAKELAKQATCLTRVGGQLRAMHLYAADNDRCIPAGPATPLALPGGLLGPPTCTIGSNQVWIGSEAACNGLGPLLEGYLPLPESLFCPGDTSSDPQEELAKVRSPSGEDAYCSYLYRQQDARAPGFPGRRLDDLVLNAAGGKVRALVLDMNSTLQIPGLPARTNHGGRRVSVGFAAGAAEAYPDPDGLLALQAGQEMRIFERLDEIFEAADLLTP